MLGSRGRVALRSRSCYEHAQFSLAPGRAVSRPRSIHSSCAAPATSIQPAPSATSAASVASFDLENEYRYECDAHWEPHRATVPLSFPPLAHELLQGAEVCWKGWSRSISAPPTVCLVHGILGGRNNLQSLAELIVRRHPGWQVLLVDLRCHGESASLPSRPQGPHGVQEAAHDLLQLLRQLRLFPRVLIGHSFGGKVVMSMVQQFSAKLPRPVQVWALDTLPGPLAGRAAVQAAGGAHDPHDDSPSRLIEVLRGLPLPLPGRQAALDAVLGAGFSLPIARWVATNLRPVRGSRGGPASPLTWTFDLEGIAEMYRSYEASGMWDLLHAPPQGLELHFVRAERSAYQWGADAAAIRSAGHGVHLLPAAGHWVHKDNPIGLYDLMAPSLRQAAAPGRSGVPA